LIKFGPSAAIPLRNIADGIYHATRAFAQGDLQDDDITSVIIKADRAG
jgi:serine phosphatase RsbU (regulator of sigma subunit)